MNRGIILSIQRFCVDDGPGIRTTVFLKGCPLRCKWCHNPESQAQQPEWLYNENHCISCMQCAAVCPKHLHLSVGGRHHFHRESCLMCGQCGNVCPSGALQPVGRTISVKEIMDTVMRDRIYYEQSGGGITLSGGEPLFQASFSLALLKSAKEAGIHTAVETCGYAAEEILQQLIPWTDLFLFDYKATDPELHKVLTGVRNQRILSNLRLLAAAKKRIILRCPLIPGVNDDATHLQAITALCRELSLKAEIMPYHTFGIAKEKQLNRHTTLQTETPDDALIEVWKQQIGIQYIAES